MWRLAIKESLVLITSACLFAGEVRAASDEYLHDFERRSDLEAWQPYSDSSGCNLANPGSAGNPSGYLQISCAGAFVGAWTRSSDFTGNLSGSRWVLSFDVANFGARHADLIDIIIYGADTAWVYYGTLTAMANGAWTTYGVTFDPSWSDDEARANNWRHAAPDGVSFAIWANTLQKVEALGFRGSVESDDVSEVRFGIDNVRLRSAP